MSYLSKEELIREHGLIRKVLSVGVAHSHADLTLEFAEEYAKRKSIAFAEWMAENHIWWNKTYKKWTGVESYTTEELYNLFLTQK